MQIKHKLIAEVIKQWRSDSEERALAEAILYMTGLHLTDLQKMSTAEVTNVLTEVIRRPEEKGCKQQEETQESKETNEEEGLLETKKLDAEFAKLDTIEEIEQTEDYLDVEPSQYSPLEQESTGEEKQPTSTLSFIETKKLKRGRKPNV